MISYPWRKETPCIALGLTRLPHQNSASFWWLGKHEFTYLDRLTSTECILQKPFHQPYDYVHTDNDSSISLNIESQWEACEAWNDGFARNRRFCPHDQSRSRSYNFVIMAVWEAEKVLMDDRLSVSKRECGVGCVSMFASCKHMHSLILGPVIEPDTFALDIKIVLCSSAKCCCDKAIITPMATIWMRGSNYPLTS